MDYLDTLREWLNSLDPALAAHLLQILRTTAWLAVLAVVFVPLERLFELRPKNIFRKAIVTDVGYYFLNSLIPGLLLSFPMALVAWLSQSILPAGFIAAVSGMPLWARLLTGMVVGEVGYYWGHRWCHEVPLLWRFHAVHHSAEEVDYLVSTRAHPMDIVFTRLCELTPLYMLGLATPISFAGSAVPIVVTLVGTFWGFFIHANVRWRFGLLEWLISTPAFHHWHHANDSPEVINKNYSPTLPWVDWIFGTFHLPKDRQPERYGIDQPVSPVLFGQLLDPFLIWRRPEPASAHVPGSDPVKDMAALPRAEAADALLLSKTEA